MKPFFVLLLLFGVCLAAPEASSKLTSTGRISTWLVLGPFPNEFGGTHGENCRGYYTDFLIARGGEAAMVPVEGQTISLDGASTLDWQIAKTDAAGILDFQSTFDMDDKTSAVAYASCQMLAPQAQKVLLKINSDDGVRVWLNGELVLDHHTGRSIEKEADLVTVQLQKGLNRFMVKVDQGTGGWALALAVLDMQSQPLHLSTHVATNSALFGKIRSARCSLSPLVSKSPDGPRQMLTGVINSSGLKKVTCTVIKSEWKKPQRFNLGDIAAGQHRFEMPLPIVAENGPGQITIQALTDRKVLEQIPFEIPKFRQLYLVQHTHTDIGYTKPQYEMLAEYYRYIDLALDFCDQTDSYPDDAKFRWTCETSWAVAEYLKYRPMEQIERLKKRIREGRIEVTGMLLNMSETADENSLAASLQPIAQFHAQGIPVVTAMQNDVNGAAWCLVDYFSAMGIRYLTMGINSDRSILPFKAPTPFWWQSPSGKQIMAFRADHYMTANPFMQNVGDLEKTKRAVQSYLDDLLAKGYPFDRIAVQFGGYSTDNSPPAVGGSDIVKKWNEMYQWPSLRLATAREFLEFVEKEHAQDLQTFRVAWPDWWTDGVGSAARESGVVRTLHAEAQANEGLLALAQCMGAAIPDRITAKMDAVQEALLYYDEHTYGAAESISDPQGSNTQNQWGQKASFAWEAIKAAGILREQVLGLLQPFMPKSETATIAVYNTLNWRRSELARVFIDHEIIPQTNDAFKFVDDSGNVAPARRLSSRPEGSRWIIWAKDIPAMGYKAYRIVPDPLKPPSLPNTSQSLVMENNYYKLVIDPQAGAVASLLDKETGNDLADASAPWRLGQLVYETLPSRGTVDRTAFKRTSVKNVRILMMETGPIWSSLKMTADLEGCTPSDGKVKMPSVSCELRLYQTCKKIEFLYSVRKASVTSPEALYAAFPFTLSDWRIVYEAQGGPVRPGVDQLPGSASDWQTLQNYVSVRNGTGQIILGSDRAPLVMFGDFNLGKWQYQEKIEQPYLFSYVMNNYWHTNFPASQQGEIEWSYYLTSSGDTTLTNATRFGWNSRTPLVARVLPAGVKKSAPAILSALEISPANILLVNAKPARDGRGVILHLRELEGKPTALVLDVKLPAKRVREMEEVNVLQESLSKPVTHINLLPFETKFIRLQVE